MIAFSCSPPSQILETLTILAALASKPDYIQVVMLLRDLGRTSRDVPFADCRLVGIAFVDNALNVWSKLEILSRYPAKAAGHACNIKRTIMTSRSCVPPCPHFASSETHVIDPRISSHLSDLQSLASLCEYHPAFTSSRLTPTSS